MAAFLSINLIVLGTIPVHVFFWACNRIGIVVESRKIRGVQLQHEHDDNSFDSDVFRAHADHTT